MTANYANQAMGMVDVHADARHFLVCAAPVPSDQHGTRDDPDTENDLGLRLSLSVR